MSRNERKANATTRRNELTNGFIQAYERNGMTEATTLLKLIVSESPQEKQIVEEAFKRFEEAAVNDTTKG